MGLLLVVYCVVQNWTVIVHVKGPTSEQDFSIRMPYKDKKRLEFFCRWTSFVSVWAYTTIGSKPSSVEHYTKPLAQIWNAIRSPRLRIYFFDAFWPPNFREIYCLFYPEQLRIKLGWETLNKYMKYFPDSRFALHTFYYGNNVCISLVDKVKLINTIRSNFEDFQPVLKDQGITPEELADNEKLYSFLKNLKSVGLNGILLGYGRNNGLFFEKYKGRSEDESSMASMWPDEDDAWLERINEKDRSFQSWDLSDLFYPRFSCDPDSEETKQLKQTYRQEREEIVKYYEGKDVVEATFSLLNRKYLGSFDAL